jgi:hypothetical protein
MNRKSKNKVFDWSKRARRINGVTGKWKLEAG